MKVQSLHRYKVRCGGDLISVFKPLNIMFSSYNSKARVPLSSSLENQESIKQVLLEILVEAGSVFPEWKVKLNEVTLAREFKPAYLASYPYQKNRGIYKFVYNVTDVVKSCSSFKQEGVYMVVKYEGGESFRVLGVLMDILLEDKSASIRYEHYTGLVQLNLGEAITLDFEEPLEPGSEVRLISYSPASSTISMNAISSRKAYEPLVQVLDEHTIVLEEHTKSITLALEKSERSMPVFISSVTAYRSIVEKPELDISDVKGRVEGSELKLQVSICNKSHVKPDKVIVSVIRRGQVVGMFQEHGGKLESGVCITREVSIPVGVLKSGEQDLVIRLIWSKLSKRWFINKVVNLSM